MKADYLEELEKLVAEGKNRVQDLDLELKQQMAKKKALDQVWESSSEHSQITPKHASIQFLQNSQRSSLSQASQFIQDQIARVKIFINQQQEIKQQQNSNIQNTNFKHIYRQNTMPNYFLSLRQSKSHRQDIEDKLTQLHEIPQYYQEKQQRLTRLMKQKQNKKKKIQRRLNLQYQTRQRQITFERKKIRIQLLQQERAKQNKNNTNQVLLNNQHLTQDLDFQSTLKYQRNKQFSSILKRIQREKNKTNKLHQKIKQLRNC